MVYVGEQEGYAQESETKRQGKKVVQVSGAELRRRLRANEEIPGRPSEEGKQQVLQLNILRRSHALVFLPVLVSNAMYARRYQLLVFG
mmetsp:Transcript_12115/g.31306  ORF Transcript_12115/g.31306 Transcript_12115/m.31306 type:complete len:88 (-) Transcript_12115:309-572(-)